MQLVLQVVEAGVLVDVEAAAAGRVVEVDRRAVVVHADLLLAREAEVVMLVQVGRVGGEQELRRNLCRAYQLWQQVALVLVVLERT